MRLPPRRAICIVDQSSIAGSKRVFWERMPRAIGGRASNVGRRALVPAAARSNLVRDATPLRSETTLWTGQQALLIHREYEPRRRHIIRQRHIIQRGVANSFFIEFAYARSRRRSIPTDSLRALRAQRAAIAAYFTRIVAELR